MAEPLLSLGDVQLGRTVAQRRTLRAAIAAGCDDLVACAGNSRCPIPFATIAEGAQRSRAGPTAPCRAAGALSGAGWAITGQWLPAIAGLLLASAVVMWWVLRQRHQEGCDGGAGCSCKPA
jgi:hypothetical protein